MAGLDEMNNFVRKFVILWKAGKHASLKVDSKHGQAFVTLELDLGHPHPPPSHPPPPRQQQQVPSPKVGVARVRRRERRAAWKQDAAD